MSIKRWWLFGLLLLTLFNLSALGAFLYHHVEVSGDADCMEESQPVYMSEELGLSLVQIARMQAHRKEFHPKVAAFFEDTHRQRLALVRELMSEQPDSLKLEHILTEIGGLQLSLQREVVRHLLEEKSVLTPAQQERFFALVLERFAVDTKHGGLLPRP